MKQERKYEMTAPQEQKSHPLAGRRMTGAEMIIQVLAEEGVDTVFGYTGGAILLVSQFTLFGDCRKGNRPGFSGAGEPGIAEACYLDLTARLRAQLGATRVATGRFGAHMHVRLLNDGPVTLILDTP